LTTDYTIGLSTSEVYDFGTDSWTYSTSFYRPRWYGRAMVLQDRYLWFGGREDTGPVTTVFEYIPGFGWQRWNYTMPLNIAYPIVLPFNYWK